MFDFKSVADACVKCGKCIPDCTIYKISGDEVHSPRGFIELLGAYQKGQLELDKQMKNVFESCFLCTHCVNVCPSSLPTDEIIEEVRADIAKTFGIAWYKRLFFYLLKHRNMMNFFSACGALLSPLLFKEIRGGGGLVPRFPLPFIAKRVIPKSYHKSFLEKYPEEILSSNSKKTARRVAIFIGCLSNYNYVSVGDSLLSILDTLGIDVFLAKSQQCCGAPAYFTGDKETVFKLIEKNLIYFESFIDSVEAVLIPEATCAAMILHDWQRIIKDKPELQEKMQKITAKFTMASQWLYAHTHLHAILASKKKQDKIITYHDPCHARKVLKIFQEPRFLIQQNYSIQEMSDPNSCCGFGGITMQTEKYEYAHKVGENKALMIKESGAEIVSAECNACRMQLNNAMHQSGVKVLFVHPLELIADAIKDNEHG